MDAARERVSILLTNWNGLENLKQALPGVLRAAAWQGLCDEVLVADDCSTDGSREWLAREHPQVKVVALAERSSFLGAANAGFRAARNRLVALLSNDMVPDERFLEPLLPHFDDPEVFAVSTRLQGPEGALESGRTVGLFALGNLFLLSSVKRYRPFSILVDAPADRACPTLYTGGNALIDRDKLLALGGYDALFHPFYFEDTDLCWRAWTRGWRVLHEPESMVTHHQRLGTIKRNFEQELVRTVRLRNRFLFLWKNLRDPLFVAAHVASLIAMCMLGWLAGNLRFYRSLGQALARWSRVRAGRAAEAPHRLRSDRQVLAAVRGPVLPGGRGGA